MCNLSTGISFQFNWKKIALVQIIKVLIPKVGLFPFDYQVIEDAILLVGDLIVVPFRNKNITGIVWEINCPPSDKKLKAVDLSLSSIGDNCYQNIASKIILSSYYAFVSIWGAFVVTLGFIWRSVWRILGVLG